MPFLRKRILFDLKIGNNFVSGDIYFEINDRDILTRLNKMIQIKRIYEEVGEKDGYRILVDRLWPRGVTKEKARLDEWDKEIAPSDDLRKWFGHKMENFEEFTRKYKAELKDKGEELQRIRELAEKQNVTLLYAARNTEVNHARVLLSVLEK